MAAGCQSFKDGAEKVCNALHIERKQFVVQIYE